MTSGYHPYMQAGHVSPHSWFVPSLIRARPDRSDIFDVMARAKRGVGDFRFTVYGYLIAFRDESSVHHARVKVRPMLAAAAMAAHSDRLSQFVCGFKQPLATGKGMRSEVRAQPPGH